MKVLIERGRYFGYPECCIESFVFIQRKQPPKGPWNETGFIPCYKCAKLIKKQGLDWFIAEYIAPRRNCPRVFPEE